MSANSSSSGHTAWQVGVAAGAPVGPGWEASPIRTPPREINALVHHHANRPHRAGRTRTGGRVGLPCAWAVHLPHAALGLGPWSWTTPACAGSSRETAPRSVSDSPLRVRARAACSLSFMGRGRPPLRARHNSPEQDRPAHPPARARPQWRRGARRVPGLGVGQGAGSRSPVPEALALVSVAHRPLALRERARAMLPTPASPKATSTLQRGSRPPSPWVALTWAPVQKGEWLHE